MPTITLDKNVFEKSVGKSLPLEDLKDRISMLGTDLERIEGNEIEVEVFPNRPDMLSEQGFARAFASFIGEKTGLREYHAESSGKQVNVEESVQNVRPYTVCALVTGLSLDEEKVREIVQIQEKLHVTHCRKRKKGAIGIYPLESISFPITYCARAPEEISFRPLEAEREMSAKELLEKHPTGQAYAHLLEGYDKYPLFIDANNEILSMPPIINAHKTGKITEETTGVFIECSGFELPLLRTCINIIVTALSEMGATIQTLELAYPDTTRVTPDLSFREKPLSLDYVNRRLGLNLQEEDMKNLLERMGYAYSEGTVYVPPYRADIMHQVDFVEDVAIAYGYENFESRISQTSTVGEEDPFEVFKNRVAQVLVGLKLLEVNTFHLTNEEAQNGRMCAQMPLVKLHNALSSDFDTLRAWVLPSLMEVLSNNKHNEYPQHLFGMGSVFKPNEKMETGIKEDERLAVALCGESADFTGIKQVLRYLCDALAVSFSVEETEHPSFIPGRVGRVTVNGKKVAFIGELHPEVLVSWGLEMPVAGMELNLSDLYKVMQ